VLEGLSVPADGMASEGDMLRRAAYPARRLRCGSGRRPVELAQQIVQYRVDRLPVQ